MSITFRKRPDHTLSVPEAKEPHLDLHSIDARAGQAPVDDDIPVLLPEAPAATRLETSPTPGGIPANRPWTPQADRTDSPTTVRRQEQTGAVHIPPPPMGARRQAPTQSTPAWQDETDDMPVLTPVQRPAQVPPFDSSASTRAAQTSVPKPQHEAGAGLSPEHQSEEARHSSPSPVAGAGSTPASSSAFPGHPAADDYAPFLNTARHVQNHHSKPELYVWSDDENDAFSQAAQADFTLNRIQPTAGRPTFDASLFRAPSRPDALAATVAPAGSRQSDTTREMQAEIDALVTELLDESHEYLKRRLLEEIPEIIAKYRHNH